MSPPQQSAAAAHTMPAWLSIAIWIALGTSMIMFNKVLLTTWSFNYPCLLTTWHCVLTTVLTQILSRTSNMLPSVQKGVVTRAEYSIRILPMAVCFACSLVTGNMAYQYISLAYIQMIKAFTPVPLLLLSFVAGLERPSFVLFFIVLVVSIGVTLSSVGELAFSETGFLLQLTAVLMDCFRVILMSLLLKDLQLDSLSLLYYTSPPSAVLTFGAFLALEADRHSWDIFTPTLCGALLLNGLLAFSLNVAVVYLVGSTNSMAMSLSAPLKDILIVLISVLLLRAPITSLQVVGFAVSLAGLHLYREHKSDPKKLAGMLGLCATKESSNSSSTSSSNSSASTATVHASTNTISHTRSGSAHSSK